ncbi:trypsin-5-like [Vanessa cardui]|uniref:trypsin-5-like n=1 Tax=Vanessa cardui TaxID=171605 RepID=UPI001F141888|nr:trypsin-5-like [Vanessa cardui]
MSILGGTDVDIEHASYHVNYGDICGGVLLDKKWVLTAAHCGNESDFIRVGSRYRLKGPRIRIKLHIIHPLYKKDHLFDYDVQLLELYRDLRFGVRVRNIKINDGICGDHITVSGWGYSEEKGDYRDMLQQVKLQLVSLQECQKVEQSWYNNTLTSRMFCAGDEDGDACQGDSGGGAVSYGQLVGLSSFGFGCGRVPGVYINVSSPYIRQWIRIYTGV